MIKLFILCKIYILQKIRIKILCILLFMALQELERVGKDKKHFMIESYRNESEMANLLYWQLTCRTFHNPEEWEWAMKEAGYHGDYSYIVFE